MENDQLKFWVVEGVDRYYIDQRSEGLRWFLSFFLHALALPATADAVILIDEPGATLHARAQQNVLDLLEKLSQKAVVIYATHSPYLVTMNLSRIVAVQRQDEDEEGSASFIIPGHQLGRASRDTLTPLLDAMGVDLSQQQFIGKDRNIVLEELSVRYYIEAFWALLGVNDPMPQLIPASGADNVPVIASLLIGWNLGFGVLLDDDEKGRRVAQDQLKRLFADEAEYEVHVQRLRKIGCAEDLFTKRDFRQHVLNDSGLSYGESNSEYVRDRAKATLAASFLNGVVQGVITLDTLDSTTVTNAKRLVTWIQELSASATVPAR